MAIRQAGIASDRLMPLTYLHRFGEAGLTDWFQRAIDAGLIVSTHQRSFGFMGAYRYVFFDVMLQPSGQCRRD